LDIDESHPQKRRDEGKRGEGERESPRQDETTTRTEADGWIFFVDAPSFGFSLLVCSFALTAEHAFAGRITGIAVGGTVGTTVNAECDGRELSLIRITVQIMGGPEPR